MQVCLDILIPILHSYFYMLNSFNATLQLHLQNLLCSVQSLSGSELEYQTKTEAGCAAIKKKAISGPFKQLPYPILHSLL